MRLDFLPWLQRMADNVTLNAGTGGSLVATDDDGSAHHQYVKIEFGADNTQSKVTDANGLPVRQMDLVAVSTVNSTSTVLAASAVFTGTSEDISQYKEITVNVIASHASATNGLSLQQSSDGTNWDHVDTYTTAAATAKIVTLQRFAKFFRLVYTNGGTLQTSFRLQTIFSKFGLGGGEVASDNISGLEHQKIKVEFGVTGSATEVSSTNPLPVTETKIPLFRGRASTFRTPGRAGTAGQKIMSIHNATGSAIKLKVSKIVVDVACTVVKAVTVLPPIIRVWKVTVLPSNGTTLTKNKIAGSTTSSANITVLGDASADATGSGTTLTATLPAGTILTQEFASRLITAAGFEPADRVEFLLGSEVELLALEGIVVFVDYVLATQNPTTDMWIASIEWEEF